MRCLIIDDFHPSIIELLEGIGVQSDYHPDIKRSEILECLSDYDGMLVRSKTKIDAEILDQGPKLKFIGRAGAGLDQIDVEEVEKRGIPLLNAPEGNRDAVGEHAVGMLLCLLNFMGKADKEIREKIWDREGNRGFELSERTVGIIGYGNMGQAFAKRAKPFGCRVLAYDKYRENYGDEFAEQASLEDLFEQCDVLSIHIPLTEETDGWLDYEFFKRFKKPIWFVNTARGRHCKLEDLMRALDEKQVLSAGLDVIENEKLHTFSPEQEKTFEKLTQRRDVILTPHVGGWSFESHVKINEVLVEKIKALKLG